jgi:Fe-S cluster assembly ATP-binding protein
MVVEAERIGFDERFLARELNVDLSGGEQKRNETLQLGVLQPAIAILDELDSGLDVDALRMVSRRVEEATTQWGLGVLAITHYSRLLHELKSDQVHILVGGRIQSRAALGWPRPRIGATPASGSTEGRGDVACRCEQRPLPTLA